MKRVLVPVMLMLLTDQDEDGIEEVEVQELANVVWDAIGETHQVWDRSVGDAGAYQVGSVVGAEDKWWLEGITTRIAG